MKIVNRINYSMFWIVGGILVIASFALFYSVIMRYLFNSPLVWAFDLTGLFAGVAALLSGGFALMLKAHVRVDVFFEKFPPRIRSLIDVVTSVFMFIMAFILVWKGWGQVAHYYELGSVARTGLNIPLWTKWLMVPIGGLLLGLQGIVELINDLSVIFRGKKVYEEEGLEWMQD